MRALETLRQAQLGKLPVYLTRQDWRRLHAHLTALGKLLPISARLITAIEDAIMTTETDKTTEKEGH
jgi:hypothetical protein